MSDYGTPPQEPRGQDPNADPYGAPPPPNPYGAPPPNPYGAPAPNPYGAPPNPYASDPYGTQVGVPYSHWVKRVGSYLIDGVITALLWIPAGIGLILGGRTTATSTDSYGNTTQVQVPGATAWVLFLLLSLLPIAFAIWNSFLRQGRTGYSIGKGVLGIKLIKEATGLPIGAGMAFLRQLCHVLDGICYIGYLWPLWDPKRQTFADKIVGSVVIDQPKV